MADEPTAAAAAAAAAAAVPADDLPAFRRQFIQTQLEKTEQVYHQLDLANADNANLKAELRAADLRIAALEGQINDAESRERAARVERDQAIAERAVLEALFAVIERTMAESKRPAAILQARRTSPPDVEAALREMTKTGGGTTGGASGEATADAV